MGTCTVQYVCWVSDVENDVRVQYHQSSILFSKIIFFSQPLTRAIGAPAKTGTGFDHGRRAILLCAPYIPNDKETEKIIDNNTASQSQSKGAKSTSQSKATHPPPFGSCLYGYTIIVERRKQS
jgi:hypothetical protein